MQIKRFVFFFIAVMMVLLTTEAENWWERVK